MAEPKFNITPEKQASTSHFLRQQLFIKPKEVVGVSLVDQTCIVTGSNTGVGFEIARQILNLGPKRLILAVRNEEKGRAAAATLQKNYKGDVTIEVWLLDLSVYDSVVVFAERAKTLDRIDLIFLNAGLSHTERVWNEHTKHDEVVQVNYISTALLAILLLPAIKAARPKQPRPTRMTFTSSEVAGWAKINEWRDPTAEGILAAMDRPGKIDPFNRMTVTKLMGQFFTAELARHVKPSLVIINGASPASIHDSEFTRDYAKIPGFAIAKFFIKFVAYSSAVGARLVVDAAVKHGEETHGQFLSFGKLVP